MTRIAIRSRLRIVRNRIRFGILGVSVPRVGEGRPPFALNGVEGPVAEVRLGSHLLLDLL